MTADPLESLQTIQEAATEASREAVHMAGNHGLPITGVEGDAVCEIAADGTRLELKKLDPLRPHWWNAVQPMFESCPTGGTRSGPVLRVIAGPNGSGKSSFFAALQQRIEAGPWVNADELKVLLAGMGWIDLEAFGVAAAPEDVDRFMAGQGEWVAKALEAGEQARLNLQGQRLGVAGGGPLDYAAALAAGFIRDRLVQAGVGFAYETVLSHPSRLQELDRARARGFQVVLYGICTEDPLVNQKRVANRVALGGHGVPSRLVRQRYPRFLANLNSAARWDWPSIRLLDNSGLAMLCKSGTADPGKRRGQARP